MKALLVVGLALLVGHAAYAQQSEGGKTSLRLKLKMGQKFKITTTVQLLTSTGAGTAQSMMRQTTKAVYFDEVLRVSPDGKTQVRHTFGETKTSMELKSGSTGWSSNAYAGLEKSATKAMIGRSVIYTLSPTGRVLDVQGVDDFVAALKKAAASRPAAERPMLQMVATAQGQSLKLKDKGVLQATIPLPDHAVGVGQSWDNGLIVLQPVMTPYTYLRSKLVNRANGISIIAVAMDVRNPARKAGARNTAMPPDMSYTGAGKGSLEIVEATGMTRRLDMATTLISKFPAMNSSAGKNDKKPTVHKSMPPITMRIQLNTGLRTEPVLR